MMRKTGRKGFTLIELLLSLAILGVLATLAAKSISQAVLAKGKLQGQIDDVSRMRDALRLMERDINLAFHHRDVEQELNDLLSKKNTAPKPGQPQVPTNNLQTNPGGQPQREAARQDPVTLFMGENDSMNFVTMNNARMLKDSRQADFIEVGYALKSCHSADGKSSSNCLWRRSAMTVDDDVLTGGDEVVLLENVTEFSLKYIGTGKQDWVNQWKSDKSGDAATRGSFPQAVEISLKVEKKTDGKPAKKYSMQIVASVHFPNNQESANNGGPQTTAPQNTQQSAPNK